MVTITFFVKTKLWVVKEKISLKKIYWPMIFFSENVKKQAIISVLKQQINGRWNPWISHMGKGNKGSNTEIRNRLLAVCTLYSDHTGIWPISRLTRLYFIGRYVIARGNGFWAIASMEVFHFRAFKWNTSMLATAKNKSAVLSCFEGCTYFNYFWRKMRTFSL